MAAVIRLKDVVDALRPWVGSLIAENTQLAPGAAEILRSYAPYKESTKQLAKRLDSYLFTALHTLLGRSMTITLDDGRDVRLFVSNLVYIADDMLGVLFQSLSPYSVNYLMLKEYSMTHESLAALRVLYQKYDDFQPPEEKTLIARIVRQSYPAWRYERWLKEDDL